MQGLIAVVFVYIACTGSYQVTVGLFSAHNTQVQCVSLPHRFRTPNCEKNTIHQDLDQGTRTVENRKPQLISQKLYFISPPRRSTKNDLTIERLSPGINAPRPRVLTDRPNILRFESEVCSGFRARNGELKGSGVLGSVRSGVLGQN